MSESTEAKRDAEFLAAIEESVDILIKDYGFTREAAFAKVRQDVDG